MRSRLIAMLGVVGVLAASCGGGGGGGASPPAQAQQNSVDVKMVDFGFAPSGTAHTGALTVNFTNDGKQPHMAVIARLDPGKTVQDILHLLQTSKQGGPPPKWFHDAPADEPLLSPGESAGVTIHASQPGAYAMLCFVTDPKTHKPHALLGMVGQFQVEKGATPAPAPKPDATFSVTKSGLKTEDLSAGENVIDVTGVTASRQFLIVQFRPGKTLQDLGKWFNTELGTPPATVYGGSSIAAGATGIASFDFKPGTYTAIVAPQGKGKPLTATFKVT